MHTEQKEKKRDQYFLFSRVACLYSNCSLHYYSHKDTVPPKVTFCYNSIRWHTHCCFRVIPSICLDDISLNNVSTSVWDFCYLLDNASSDDASLGQCHSWMTHLLEDESL
jgi:hypothetical protein